MRDPKTGLAIVADEQIGVHVAHCCKRHGCKYSWYHISECPVAEGFETQMAGCEYCYYEDQAREKAIKLLVEKFNGRMHAKFAWFAPELMRDNMDYADRRLFEPEVDDLLDAGMLAVDFR
jgi:hypothetical protein